MLVVAVILPAICSPPFLYLQQEGILLAHFPPNTLIESQGEKEAELHLKLFSF